MTETEIKRLLEQQQVYYKSGITIPVKFRIEQLKKLHATVKKCETEINDALKSDLGKSHYEGFMCESGLVNTAIVKPSAYSPATSKIIAKALFSSVWFD